MHHIVPQAFVKDYNKATQSVLKIDGVPGHAMDKQAHRLMTNGVPGVKEGMNQRILRNPGYLGASQSDRAQMIVQYYFDEGETAMELAAKAWFQSHGVLP